MPRPHECPECGNPSFRKRYTTGAGWRVDCYVCTACGHRVRR
jgi:ribosomal protein L37AE/L43A